MIKLLSIVKFILSLVGMVLISTLILLNAIPWGIVIKLEKALKWVSNKLVVLLINLKPQYKNQKHG